jgi:hypothetical protein
MWEHGETRQLESLPWLNTLIKTADRQPVGAGIVLVLVRKMMPACTSALTDLSRNITGHISPVVI